MNRPPDLNSAEREFLQGLLNRFRSAWRQGDTPPDAVGLRKFLPPPEEPLRALALQELIKTDLEMQWQRGRNIVLEKYLAQFPELGTAQTVPAPLICEEYRVRHCYGDKPPLTAYQARFPEQFPEVQRLVQASPLPASLHATLKPSLFSAAPTRTPEDEDAATPRASAPPASPPVSPHLAKPSDSREVLPVVGDYKLITRIGRGGFGDVWRAEAPGGVEVAVKIIVGSVSREEAGQRELQALELMRRLHHAYLLPTHAYWQMDDQLLIVMELADGSLRDCVKKREREGKPGLPLEELVRYFREAAEAVDYLHANHVLHRDLKPENILLIGGHAQVADFGLARVLEQTRGLTATRGCGTPAYMPPEVIGQGKVGEQSDQYSLAAAYAELRLNHPLFPSSSFFDLMQDHVKRVPDLAPLDKAEQQILHRALAKDPRQRYGSCTEFMQELEKALAPKPPEPPRPSLTRHLLVASLLLFPLLAVIGFLAWYLSPGAPGMRVIPQSVVLRAGETATVTLELKGTHRTELVQLTFPARPENVTIADGSGPRGADGPVVVTTTGVTVPEGRDSVELRLLAAPDAVPASCQVTVQAAAADRRQEATFGLTIEPRAYFLPRSWEKAAEAKAVSYDGKVYYDQIDVLRGGTRVRFVLIPKDKSRREAPETFYMMQDKVWVGLYREFADASGGALKDQHWKEMSVNENERYPVMGVTVDDAHRFARWLDGYLPLSAQWDQAAGRYRKDRGEGPFLKPSDKAKPQVAVGRDRPEEVGKSRDDISPFGVRDMAGNGFEFTRNLLDDDNLTVPLPNPDAGTLIKLRGLSYRAEQPLSFKEWEKGAQPYGNAEESTGFRVVIEP